MNLYQIYFHLFLNFHSFLFLISAKFLIILNCLDCQQIWTCYWNNHCTLCPLSYLTKNKLHFQTIRNNVQYSFSSAQFNWFSFYGQQYLAVFEMEALLLLFSIFQFQLFPLRYCTQHQVSQLDSNKMYCFVQISFLYFQIAIYFIYFPLFNSNNSIPFFVTNLFIDFSIIFRLIPFYIFDFSWFFLESRSLHQSPFLWLHK